MDFRLPNVEKDIENSDADEVLYKVGLFDVWLHKAEDGLYGYLITEYDTSIIRGERNSYLYPDDAFMDGMYDANRYADAAGQPRQGEAEADEVYQGEAEADEIDRYDDESGLVETELDPV